MQGRKEIVVTWPRYVTSTLVLAMGLVADNVFATMQETVVATLFPIACGLAVGALAVLTFARREAAFLVAASFYSALTVIALTLPLTLITHMVVLAVGVVTILACLLTPLIIPIAKQPTPVQVSVETDDRHR